MIDKTRLAIEGLPADELAERLEAMETLYQREIEREKEAWREIGLLNEAYSDVMLRPWWFDRTAKLLHIAMQLNIKYAELLTERIEPMGVLRAMIQGLAHGYQQRGAAARSEAINAENLRDRLRMKERHDMLAVFLRETFPSEWEESNARNVDTFALAKGLLLKFALDDVGRRAINAPFRERA